MLPGYLNLDNISIYPIDKSLRNAYNLNIETNNSQKDNTLYPLSEEQQYKILYDITQVKLSPPKIGDNLLPKIPVKITPPTYIVQSTGTYQTINNDNNDMIPNGYSVGTTTENSNTANKYNLTLEKFSNINNISCFKYEIFYFIVFIIVIIIFIIKNIINKKI